MIGSNKRSIVWLSNLFGMCVCVCAASPLSGHQENPRINCLHSIINEIHYGRDLILKFRVSSSA